MKLFFRGDISGLMEGINICSGDLGFELSPEGLEIAVEKIANNGLKIVKRSDRACIQYCEKIHFF
jgi:hypothetical protein